MSVASWADRILQILRFVAPVIPVSVYLARVTWARCHKPSRGSPVCLASLHTTPPDSQSPSIPVAMARRTPISAIIILAVLAFFSITYLFSSSDSSPSASFGSGAAKAPAAPLVKDSSTDPVELGQIDSNILIGESIAPKLENATLKYVHRVTARWCFLSNKSISEPNSVAPPGSSSTP